MQGHENQHGAGEAFGLIVIGDEVLTGSRVDTHFPEIKRLVSERGHTLAWFWLLPDDPGLLTEHLRFSFSRSSPVLVFGGIGATPDDHTRACAAAAAGVSLVRHAEARALIESRFGPDAYPSRILMADLPEGAGLIPNPVNQIPGFSLRGHWFLPGFPQMAWPMARWVLERHFGVDSRVLERALEVRGVPESRLIPLMRRLGERFPGFKLFSLPHLGPDAHILIGFRGRQGLDQAVEALRVELEQEGIEHRDTVGGDQRR